MSPVLCFFLPLLEFFLVITSSDTHTYPSHQQTEALSTLSQSVSILLVKDLYMLLERSKPNPTCILLDRATTYPFQLQLTKLWLYLSVVFSLCRPVYSHLCFKRCVSFLAFFPSYSFSTFCYLAGFVLVVEQCSLRVKISIQFSYILRCLICTIVLNHCVSEMKIYLLFLWHKSFLASFVCFLWLLNWVKLGQIWVLGPQGES